MATLVRRSAFKWSSAFSVGIASIDDDHRYALDLLSVLDDVDGDALKTTLAQVLDRLTIFAHIHFQREEIVFQQVGLVLDAGHCADHDYFKRAIAEIRAEVVLELSIDRVHGIVDFIHAWVWQHLTDHDAKLRTVSVDKERVDRIARMAVPPLSSLIGLH